MVEPMIPDDELLALADVVTVWVASPSGPKDVWSLAEAAAWAMQHPERDKVVLFCPGVAKGRSMWVHADQLARICAALQGRDVAA